MAYYATVKERLRYIYTYISIYYIKGKGSIHGNILEEALLNKSLKNAHSVNVIVRSFSIYLYLSEDQADLWARDKRNCSKDISCEVKTATNTNKYEEITCFQKVLKRGMSQYMFCSACFDVVHYHNDWQKLLLSLRKTAMQVKDIWKFPILVLSDEKHYFEQQVLCSTVSPR